MLHRWYNRRFLFFSEQRIAAARDPFSPGWAGAVSGMAGRSSGSVETAIPSRTPAAGIDLPFRKHPLRLDPRLIKTCRTVINQTNIATDFLQSIKSIEDRPFSLSIAVRTATNLD
jgi:hypothetical protein